MLGILPATQVFGQRMKACGELMEHWEVVLHPKVLDEGDELAGRFIIRASARASEAIRRAAATRSPPMKTFEPGSFFVSFTGITQAGGNGNARTVSGTSGFDWTSRSE